MPAYTNVLNELFARSEGAICVHAANGETIISDDIIEVGAFASNCEDPWLDLVTSSGEAIGLKVLGNPKVCEPQPSIELDDGMIYMIDGDAVPGQKQGFHLLPMSVLLNGKGKADLAGLNFYPPEAVDIHTPGSTREITLMSGRSRQEAQGKWKSKSSTFGQFTDMLRNHVEGEKDGPCYLQGESADGARKSAAQIANHIIGVDLDSGAPIGDVIAAIEKHRLEAVIYTTHSHLKDTSVIKRDAFMKQMGTNEADPALIRQYLIEEKGVLPQIVENVEVLDAAKHTAEGVVILVRHKKMPKFRAVFPLSEPFVFAKRGGSQQDAILEWKERYAGFCTDMGFFFDQTCVDPARLFYLPRHPAGDTKYNSWLICGDPVDLDKFDRVKMSRRKKPKAGPANAFTAAGLDEDDEADRYVTSDGFNLRRWGAKHAKRFEIQQMLEEVVGGDFIREARQSGKQGVHVECPFEAEHTNLGGGGTFVVNASDNLTDGFEGGFSFNCVHNACQGRDRYDMLKQLIEDDVISRADLENKDYLLALEDDEEDEPAPVGVRARTVTGEGPANTRDKETGNVGHDATAAARNDRAGIMSDIDDDLASEDEDRILRAFNRRYAVIRTSGGVRILVEPETAEDDVMFESQNDVSLMEKNRTIWTGGGANGKGAKKMEAFKVWLEWSGRRTYKKVVFAPGQEVPKSTYNLFRGFPFEPVKGDWSILRDHVFVNICDSNEEHFEWLMTWFAMLFQKPDAKPGSTVVITGGKGTGKSTLFDYINQLLGRHGITVSQRKQIVGQFNGHLATTLLMVCEEAFWAADPQAEGVLKDMITNKSVLIEKKGYDPIQSDNYTRLALISNSEWVVPASLKDERRFFVLRCSDAVQGNTQFFDDMRRQMEKEGGLEAMLYDLLNWKPMGGSFTCLYKPPVTAHLQVQQIESLSGVQKFMLELVKAGQYESNDERIAGIELNTERETHIHAVDMRAAVQDYVRFSFSSDKAKTTFDDISVVVTDWFGAREVNMLTEGSQNRKRTFIFPPLAEVRAKLKEAKGLDIEAMPLETVKALKTNR